MTSTSSSAHWRGVDVLRGALALAVVATHTLELEVARYGAHAVPVFFVLSGFLLGGQLVDLRDRAPQAPPGARARTWWLFQQRRWLRLLPLYYVAVGVAALLSVRPGTGSWLTVLTLTSSPAGPPTAAHLGMLVPVWSLAVEEQWYLLVPLLVLVPPRAHLVRVLAATALAGAAWRWAVCWGHLGPGWVGLYTLPGCLDAFAGGVLLAVGLREAPERTRDALGPLLAVGSVLCLGAAIGELLTAAPAPSLDRWPGGREGLVLLSLGLVAVARDADPGTGRLARVGVWLGKRSYGIYLLHLLVAVPLVMPLYPSTEEGWPHGYGVFVLVTAVTLVLAEVAHRLVERPMERLRARVSLRAT